MEINTSDEVYENYEYDTKTKWVKIDDMIKLLNDTDRKYGTPFRLSKVIDELSPKPTKVKE